MKRVALSGACAALVLLSGCATTDGQSSTTGREVVSGIAGCGVGLLIGALAKANSATMASLCAGAGAVGYAFAKSLDDREKARMREAELQALDSNQRVDWQATRYDEDQAQAEGPPAGAPAEASPAPEHHARSYSQRNPKYCRAHPKTCEERDRKELASAGGVAVPGPKHSAPVHHQHEVVTATGYVIPVSTEVNASGQTCKVLQESVSKNSNTGSGRVKWCKASSGWVVAALAVSGNRA